MTQLSFHNEDNIEELLDLRVVCFGLIKNFTNEVDRALHLERMSLFLSLDDDHDAHDLHRGHDIEQ